MMLFTVNLNIAYSAVHEHSELHHEEIISRLIPYGHCVYHLYEHEFWKENSYDAGGNF